VKAKNDEKVDENKNTTADMKVLNGDSQSTGILVTAIPARKKYKQTNICVNKVELPLLTEVDSIGGVIGSPLLSCTAVGKYRRHIVNMQNSC